MSEAEAGKAAAAAAAAALVQDGMVVGLGTGSTAARFIPLLGDRIRFEGLRITGVPTSRAAAELAGRASIPLATSPPRVIDLAVDGADEIDAGLRLIKGRGGALLREKLVAEAARRFAVIADSSKLVDRLGVGVLPVEVVPFLWERTAGRLERLGGTWRLRGEKAEAFVTDNGNLILDLAFEGGIADPEALAESLKATTGVVEHGLFLQQASECLVGGPDGVRRLTRGQGAARGS